MEISEEIWQFIQNHLGYSDEEMKLFRDKPKNAEIIAKAPELMSKTIVAEVVDSQGCNSQHQVGDKIYFDGAGNLLTKLSPKRICVHALSALSGPIYVANELFYAGVDPNDMSSTMRSLRTRTIGTCTRQNWTASSPNGLKSESMRMSCAFCRKKGYQPERSMMR